MRNRCLIPAMALFLIGGLFFTLNMVVAADPIKPPLTSATTRPSPDDAPASEDAKNFVSSNDMAAAFCIVGSSEKDEQALGGFGPSDNLPKRISSSAAINSEQWYLLAEPTVVEKIGDKLFMRLCIVNPTAHSLVFGASDSRLSIVQEAMDEKGTWRSVEYLTSSWCGNSRHRVMLGAAQFWSVPVPRYQGSMKTKLRFRFDLPGQQVYSNEFDGSVNPTQFTQKQARRATNIMDPTVDVPGTQPTNAQP